MIQLPAALAPWATELALLPSDLALTLAPWVGRLALALGPMSEIRTSVSAEPDGYGGLARRGSYERLVTAEWAMADLFPDEFLRRAAAGEHLFLDLARRGPRGAMRSIAIVSAGPDQLGGPRLAHLALLIVLARRAATAGAQLDWGVLEDPDHRLCHGLDAEGIRRLLAARTSVTAGEPVVATWRAALGGDGFDGWFIGGPRLAPWARRAGASSVTVADVLEPNVRALDLAVTRRGPPSTVRLPLPAPEVCVRLLRDPLGRGARSRSAVTRQPAQQLRFAAAGRRLLVIGDDGDVESWPVPQSPRDVLGRSRHARPPGRLVAVGADQRAVLAVTVDDADPAHVRVWQGQGRIATLAVPPYAVASVRAALSGRRPVGGCGRVRLRPGRDELFLEGIDGTMYLAPSVPEGGSPPDDGQRPGPMMPFLTVEPGTVLASRLTRNDALWVQRTPAEIQIVRTTEAGTAVVGRIRDEVPEVPEVHFGGEKRDVWGVVAVRGRGATWHIVTDSGPALPAVEVAAPVVGVTRDKDGVRLLVRDDDRRLAWFGGTGAVEAPPPASAPIATAVHSPFSARVAWLTTAGEVVVYSFDHGAVLMRLTSTGGGARRGAG